jgi:Flp pilus assembly protein TadG
MNASNDPTRLRGRAVGVSPRVTAIRRKTPNGRRRGAVLVLFVVSVIPIMAFMAFAIDVGMMTVAQTQLRDAADAAALAGCRALNGNASTNNNYAGAAPAAQNALTANDVLGNPLQTSQLTVTVGQYAYSTSAAQFQGTFPTSLTSGNWDMVQATVTTNVNNSLGFGRIFNFALPNFVATSTAAFRPRDIVVILDFSGSMRFDSLLGTPYYGNRNCNNQDTLVPTFGHYSAGSSATGMPASNAAWPYANSNITCTSSDGRPPVVLDFYTNGSGTLAFSNSASASYATTPGGDVPCKSNSGTSASYAQTVGQVLNISNPGNSTRNATFESQGYAGLNMTTGTLGFQGYTQGPGYWGKTFYYWPPDPTNDWRSKYFTFSGGTADNSVLWDNNGNWQAPGGGSPYYTINYTAILNFIKNVGPSVFPTQLQSGRILYYSSIPSTIDTSVWPPADLNQRFWKDYIDYVLGVMQVSSNQYVVINNGQTGLTGYGSDFQWGTVKITALSSLSGSPKPYMHYGDNPLRPILSFWFGPMTMIDFLGNYNLWYTGYGNDASRYCWWPGTCHESPTYACKLGVGAAFSDMQNNHPNDMLSLIMFSTPLSGSNDTGANRFNRPVVGLSQSYSTLSDSLWYPQATVGSSSATVTPYDANNLTVPRAMGGTCYSMALMLAYNQFSGNSALVNYNTSTLPAVNSYDAGGGGRQGAQKIIIFETDGDPNCSAQANFVNGGSCNCYYKVRYNQANTASSEYPTNINGYSDNSPTLVSQILSLVSQLAAQTSANGYSTPSKPLLFNCIAFGQIIDAAGLSTLNQMQVAGNVNDGSSNSLPSWKIINGNASTYASALQTAIGTIVQDGVQVSLIQ